MSTEHGAARRLQVEIGVLRASGCPCALGSEAGAAGGYNSSAGAGLGSSG